MKRHCRADIERLLTGRTIAGVTWREADPLSGRPLQDDDLDVLSLTLDDGSVLEFDGSEQIGLSAVWLTLKAPADTALD